MKSAKTIARPADRPFRLLGYTVLVQGDGNVCKILATISSQTGGSRRVFSAEESVSSPASVLQKAMLKAFADHYGRDLVPVELPREPWISDMKVVYQTLKDGLSSQVNGGKYGQGD